MAADRAALLELLTAIERAELPLLTWGMVDAGFTHEELHDLVAEKAPGVGLGAEDPALLVQELREHFLVHRFRRGDRSMFRSRMAETMRLLARLRQIFRNEDWRAGRPLVADFRLVLRPRERPRRTMTPDEVVERLRSTTELTPFRESATRAYLADCDKTLSLARFQCEATEQVLGAVDRGPATAVVVTAGTGSGKTHAFYLPAMTIVAERIRQDPTPSVKALGLYPRRELLKDQLATALRTARRLDGVLEEHRPIRIGAWYGATLLHAAEVRDRWSPFADGHRCPYFDCPWCGGPMVWPRNARREHVVCQTCRKEVDDNLFAFTRRALQDRPADILFSTTESLNRQLASTYAGKVFGTAGPRRPVLCLLDEIHTYSGTHGAQVANLVRRWRHAVGSPVQFVGLSATLENAEQFMADLVGLPEGRAVRVRPATDDLLSSGAEYLVALRHNPTWGTPLSTTIQATMLLARALDPPRTSMSDGAFGSKVFAFTDRLDSVNRLYWDLLDAEGLWNPTTRKQRYQPLTLAALRAPRYDEDDAEARARQEAGQVWDLAQELGHELLGDQPLRLGRTTSQDAGVEADAQVVVATASLEVGYDDDAVGAVVQHKAPHDPATFLQRKGRAGRLPQTRPWTVVVLSDFGRDRLAYQAYDQLFSPVLEARSLPVRNRYVLRMQAVYSFMNWLSRQLGPTDANVWNELAGPRGRDGGLSPNQRRAADIVRDVIAGGRGAARLERHLAAALQLSPADLDAVLWDPPRALMTRVLPTLLRRLDSGWATGADVGAEPRTTAPLPEFVPSSLFADLMVPEIEVTTPEFRGRPGRSDTLGLEQALRELAPGNVTRRYAVAGQQQLHWVPIDGEQADVTALYGCLDEGVFDDGVRCYRPVSVTLHPTSPGIGEFERGSLQWRAEVVADTGPAEHVTPDRTVWSDVLDGLGTHLHRDGNPIRMRRFASSVEYTRLDGTVRRNRCASFVDPEGRRAALGFEQEVDAVRLSLCPIAPEALRARLHGPYLASSRWAYLRHRFEEGAGFPSTSSAFDRHWLRTALVAALCEERSEGERGLAAAAARLQSRNVAGAVAGLVADLFEAINAEGEDAERGRTFNRLVDLLRSEGVEEALVSRMGVLVDPPNDAWLAWERDRLRTTVAGAFLHAATLLCRDVDPYDLNVDLLPDDPAGVWISEASPGGIGTLERIVDAWNTAPGRFLRVMEAAVAPSDFEELDERLRAVLQEAAPEGSAVATAMGAVRDAWDGGSAAVAEATANLLGVVERAGHRLGRAAAVTLSTRLLAPGTSTATDDVYRWFLEFWESHEQGAEVELDSRVVACLGRHRAEIDEPLRLGDAGSARRFGVLSSLLWPRGPDVRQGRIEVPNRFTEVSPSPAPALLRAFLGPAPDEVDAAAPDWRERVERVLRTAGDVLVDLSSLDGIAARAVLVDLAVRPVDCGFLFAHPVVERVERGPHRTVVRLQLREVAG